MGPKDGKKLKIYNFWDYYTLKIILTTTNER